MNKVERLEKIKKDILNSVNQKLKNIKEPKDGTVLKVLADKFENLSSEYTNIGNESAKEFVDLLNSDEFESVDMKIKEKLNDDFRAELKEILIEFPKKYLSK